MTKQGLGATGAVLTGLAVVVGGKNTFGKTGDVKLPEWEYEVVDSESTGIPKDVKMTIPIFDLSQEIILAFKNEESIVLKGNYRDEGEDKPIVIGFTGQLQKMSPEFKEGEKTGRSFEVRVDTFEETIDGKQTVKYNRGALELILGGDGKNLLEKFATNIL